MDLVTLAMARESGGTEITVDTALSDTSTNPVQNRAIKQGIMAAITDAFADITEFSYYICQTGEYDTTTLVPKVTNPDRQHIYLVPDGEDYLEYVWISGANYDLIGTTEIDLTGYAKEEDLENYALKSEVPEVPEISTDIIADAQSNEKTASPKAVGEYGDFIKSLIPELAYSISDALDTAATPYAVKQYADHIAGEIPTVPQISTSIDQDAASDEKTASPKAVKTYYDGRLCKDVEAYNYSDSLVTTPKAVAAYVSASVLAAKTQISTDISGDAASNTKAASPKAVKTYVDGKVPTVPAISTNISTDAASDTKTASPKAVKTYVDGKVPTNLVTGKDPLGVDTAFTLKISRTAPASGTASNIITIVVE